MKRLVLSLLFLLTLGATMATAAGGKADPRTMSFPELRFEIPAAERVVLDCGMPVYLLRDT